MRSVEPEASNLMAGELFLEIGTEELPAAFLGPAIEGLKEATGRLLTEGRLPAARIETMGTPRRLVLAAEGVPSRQEPEERDVIGPPRAAAFDAQGRPTAAATGFARAQGVRVEDLEVRRTERGEYAVARVRSAREIARRLLPGLLARLIGEVPFPKTMRWEGGTRFARPIRWIVALYDGRVVPFEVAGVRAGSRSRGHRFLAPAPFPVRDAKEYLGEAERRFVVVDPQRRKAMIREQVLELIRKEGGEAEPDPGLLEWTAALVEYPFTIVGSFDPHYLELPPEVLETVLTHQQGYFPLRDRSGRMLPRFACTMNNRPMPEIVEGHERVLRARLEDARFYLREDERIPLAQRVEALRGVVFHERIGTLYEKMERVTRLAERLASIWHPDRRETVREAARRAKADLVTGMVREFPELQGVIGRIYARREGAAPEVAQAIEEQYRPRFPGDRLPETPAGRILSVADRLDTIETCFAAGLIPTGSEDPYALRRQAAGLIAVVLAEGKRVALRELITKAVDGVTAFLRARLEAALPYRQDLVAAAMAADARLDPVDLERRCAALTQLVERDPALVVAIRRVLNILPGPAEVRPETGEPGAGGEAPAVEPEASDQVEPEASDQVEPEASDQVVPEASDKEEQALRQVFEEVARETRPQLQAGDYEEALKAWSRLSESIDRFFLKILVMDPDPAVRGRRLGLLGALAAMFGEIADFSQVADV